uniref:Uncharacterized protein n=1 Tax=Megaselia scalaris TaxID=36166 RepID=T1GNE1_MEGSC
MYQWNKDYKTLLTFSIQYLAWEWESLICLHIHTIPLTTLIKGH